ncbi:MAG: DUF1559 domain-containing protein [Planctomycetota bacterium]
MVAIPRTRQGVTIIELLVAIAIVGVLCAILVPAVMHSRERSRDLQCRNHLHQIGLAFGQFEESHGFFPTSGNPFSRIAERLELQDGVLRCPSDVRNDPAARFDRSYFINDGTRFRYDHRNGFAVQPFFMIVRGRRDCRAADITDGLSSTAAASERLLCLMSDQGRSEAELRAGDPKRFLWYLSAGVPTENELARACTVDRQTPFPLDIRPSGYGDLGYDHILPPNVPGCYNSPPVSDRIIMNDAIPPSSQHTGHVNLLLCDGSVRPITDHISMLIWRAIGTRNGSETVEW